MKYSKKSKNLFVSDYSIALLVCIFLSLIILVYNPFSLYSSDVKQFDPAEMPKTIGVLFGFFLLSCFFCAYFLKILSYLRIFRVITYGCCVIFFITFIYNFVLNYNVLLHQDYGVLDQMSFIAPREIFNTPKMGLILVDLLVGIISMILAFIGLYYRVIFRKILVLFVGAFGCVSVFYAIQISLHTSLSDHKKTQSSLSHYLDSKQDELDSTLKPIVRFSKNKNVFLLVLDAFTGSHFEDILEMYPNLREEFSDFIYFPNTVSTSSFTAFTTFSVAGGHFYSLSDMYSRYHHIVGRDIIYKEAKKAFVNLAKDFSTRGYESVIYSPEPVSLKDEKLGKDVFSYDDKVFREYFFYHHQKELAFLNDIPKDFIAELFNYGLFKASPYSLRTKLYVDYGWSLAKSSKIKQFSIVAENASDLLSLPYLLQANAEKPTFKYFKTMITHQPGGLDVERNCLPSLNIKTKLPKKYQLSILNSYMSYHFDNEVCAIFSVAKIIDWLKKEGIYNQTQIVITSDHGLYDAYKQMENNHGDQLGRHSNPLLLFKPFHQAKHSYQNLIIDQRLMSNADATGLAYDGAFGKFAPAYPVNILRHYPENRSVIHVMIDSSMHSMEKIFRVKENSFDPKNWQDITQEVLQTLQKDQK